MQLITLSPLHISSDVELTPAEFVVEENKVKAYPLDYLLNSILKKEMSRERRELLMADLKRSFLNADGPFSLSEFFRRHALEIPPVFEIMSASPEVSGNIKLLPWGPEGPYIPGSEVKGALRFLFVYGAFKKDSSLRRDLISDLRKILPKKTSNLQEERRALLDKLETLWQIYEKRIMRPTAQQEANWDIFRFLSVSDSAPAELKSLSVEKILVLNTRRKIENFVVTIKPYEKVKFTMNFVEDFSEIIKICERFHTWRYRSMLSLSFLREVGYDFFKSWLEYELNFLKQASGISPLQKEAYEKSLKKLEEIVNKFYHSSGRFIPIRLGRYQGFMSLTLSLLILQEDRALFEELFRGVIPRVSSQVNKTRSVTERQCMPLGWVILHV